MTTPSEAAQLVAEHLVGSCERTIESSLEDLKLDPDFEHSDEFCAALDGDVFCCVGCGWWCYQPAVDQCSEWYCENCAEDEEEV
jgi:hypothetical protein